MLINVMSLYLANMAKRSVNRVFNVFGGLCKNYIKYKMVFEVFRTYTNREEGNISGSFLFKSCLLIKFWEFFESNSRVTLILNFWLLNFDDVDKLVTF